MKRVLRQSYLPYTAAQMYALVDDIPAYPHFLPGCQRAEVLERTPSQVIASLSLSKFGIEKKFTTLNRLTPHTRIDLSLVEGPFSHLAGAWTFNDLGTEGSKIALDLSYESEGLLLDRVFSTLFDFLANHLVQAFCQRAEQLYGGYE